MRSKFFFLVLALSLLAGAVTATEYEDDAYVSEYDEDDSRESEVDLLLSALSADEEAAEDDEESSAGDEDENGVDSESESESESSADDEEETPRIRLGKRVRRMCRRGCRRHCKRIGKGRKCRRSCRKNCLAKARLRAASGKALGLGAAGADGRQTSFRKRLAERKARQAAQSSQLAVNVQKYATLETKRLIKWFINSYLNTDAVATARRVTVTPREVKVLTTYGLNPPKNGSPGIPRRKPNYEPEKGPSSSDPEPPLGLEDNSIPASSPAKWDNQIVIPGLVAERSIAERRVPRNLPN